METRKESAYPGQLVHGTHARSIRSSSRVYSSFGTNDGGYEDNGSSRLGIPHPLGHSFQQIPCRHEIDFDQLFEFVLGNT